LFFSMSLHHKDHPFSMNVNGQDFGVEIGLVTQSRECLEATPIGEDLFGYAYYPCLFQKRRSDTLYAARRQFPFGRILTALPSGSFLILYLVNLLTYAAVILIMQYYGSELQVECPTGSGDYMDLAKVAEEIQHRLIHIFGRDMEGRRATNGGNPKLDRDPHFRDYVLFHEVSFVCYSVLLCLVFYLPCRHL